MEEALDLLTLALRQRPERADILDARTCVNLARDAATDALRDIESAVRLAPDSPDGRP